MVNVETVSIGAIAMIYALVSSGKSGRTRKQGRRGTIDMAPNSLKTGIFAPFGKAGSPQSSQPAQREPCAYRSK